MKALKPKDVGALRRLGQQYLAAKRNMSRAEFAQWKRQQAAFRHEARPDKITVDIAARLAHLAAMPGLKKFEHKLPSTGVSTLRELPKLGEFWLEKLFEVDLIGPQTTRAQIDVLRGLQTGKPVAPRHRKAAP